MVAAVIAAAGDRDMPVAAHAHRAAGIGQAVAARVDRIEHCTWTTEDDFHLDHGIVNAIAEQRIKLFPDTNHLARQASRRLLWSVRRAHLDTMLSVGV